MSALQDIKSSKTIELVEIGEKSYFIKHSGGGSRFAISEGANSYIKNCSNQMKSVGHGLWSFLCLIFSFFAFFCLIVLCTHTKRTTFIFSFNHFQ